MTRSWALLVLVAAATVVVASACSSRGAAFVLSAQSQPVVETYEFARQNQPLLEQVACYCGCGVTLEHRSLRDCFYTDGGVADAHAASCGVCIAEASEARRMQAEGMDAAAIAAAIDAQFEGAGRPTTNR